MVREVGPRPSPFPGPRIQRKHLRRFSGASHAPRRAERQAPRDARRAYGPELSARPGFFGLACGPDSVRSERSVLQRGSGRRIPGSPHPGSPPPSCLACHSLAGRQEREGYSRQKGGGRGAGGEKGRLECAHEIPFPFDGLLDCPPGPGLRPLPREHATAVVLLLVPTGGAAVAEPTCGPNPEVTTNSIRWHSLAWFPKVNQFFIINLSTILFSCIEDDLVAATARTRMTRRSRFPRARARWFAEEYAGGDGIAPPRPSSRSFWGASVARPRTVLALVRRACVFCGRFDRGGTRRGSRSRRSARNARDRGQGPDGRGCGGIELMLTFGGTRL